MWAPTAPTSLRCARGQPGSQPCPQCPEPGIKPSGVTPRSFLHQHHRAPGSHHSVRQAGQRGEVLQVHTHGRRATPGRETAEPDRSSLKRQRHKHGQLPCHPSQMPQQTVQGEPALCCCRLWAQVSSSKEKGLITGCQQLTHFWEPTWVPAVARAHSLPEHFGAEPTLVTAGPTKAHDARPGHKATSFLKQNPEVLAGLPHPPRLGGCRVSQ